MNEPRRGDYLEVEDVYIVPCGTYLSSLVFFVVVLHIELLLYLSDSTLLTFKLMLSLCPTSPLHQLCSITMVNTSYV